MTTPAAPARPTPGGTFPLAGRPTPRVGYGMGQVTRKATDAAGRDNALRVLRHAFELGITHYDTAQFYGNGLANELLRDTFGTVRDEIMLATKAGAKPLPGASIPLGAAQQPAELREAVEQNLRVLNTDRLDVVNLRRMDFVPGLLAQGDQIVPIEDQLAELSTLREEGKIIGIGLSHITLDQLRTAIPVGIACVQNIYNLLSRDDEDMLAIAERHGIAWVPYFPLGGGYGSLPKVTDVPAVIQIAADVGVTPSQVGLAWQLTHSQNTMIIAGTGSIDHLDENTAAAQIKLGPATISALETSR